MEGSEGLPRGIGCLTRDRRIVINYQVPIPLILQHGPTAGRGDGPVSLQRLARAQRVSRPSEPSPARWIEGGQKNDDYP